MVTHNYELMFIVNPEFSEEETENLLARIQGYLEGANSTVFHNESWGLRRLAYPIKKYHEGRYYLMRFTMAPQNIATFERSLRLAEGVLRELITRYDAPVPEIEVPKTGSSKAEEPAPPAPETVEAETAVVEETPEVEEAAETEE